jgi:CBS domain-containing protein
MQVLDLNTPVKNVMTDRVISVGPNTVMTDVVEIFRTNHIHHLPVLDDQKIVGIISTAEIGKLEHHFTLFKTKDSDKINTALFASLIAREVMTSQVATIHVDDTVQQAADVFKENLFRALPVVNDDKDVVGILTPYDLMIHAYSQSPPKIT